MLTASQHKSSLTHKHTHQLVLDVGVPQAQAVQVVQQVLVDDGELARQHTAHIDVGGVGLQAGREIRGAEQPRRGTICSTKRKEQLTQHLLVEEL